ncbi:MAG: glycosyltransferase family 2 protein [archaeon]|jgi:glycosyltransferase involved in cell wall biosynthesis
MVNVVAVVFAHNEEKPLKVTLEILTKYKREGRIKNIVVVNDGSTDKTSEVAKSFGVNVITHPQNLGKRKSFISGATEAKRLGADVMLSLDADIQRFPRKTLEQMVETVTNGKKLMSIAQQHEVDFLDLASINERTKTTDPHSNAQRAINMVALDPLFKRNRKWIRILTQTKPINPVYPLSYRWGLEFGLDQLIPSNKVVRLEAPILTRLPFRKGTNHLEQDAGRVLVQKVINSRRRIRHKIKIRRAKRGLITGRLRK